jgi:hypothetical protein
LATGSRGVRISGSKAGYTMLRGSVKGTGYPLHSLVFPSRTSPCGIAFQLDSVNVLMSQTRSLLPVRPHYCHRNSINRHPVRQIRVSFQASISILCLL